MEGEIDSCECWEDYLREERRIDKKSMRIFRYGLLAFIVSVSSGAVLSIDYVSRKVNPYSAEPVVEQVSQLETLLQEARLASNRAVYMSTAQDSLDKKVSSVPGFNYIFGKDLDVLRSATAEQKDALSSISVEASSRLDEMKDSDVYQSYFGYKVKTFVMPIAVSFVGGLMIFGAMIYGGIASSRNREKLRELQHKAARKVSPG